MPTDAPRCEPPEGTAVNTLHYIKHPSGGAVSKWVVGHWTMDGGYARVEDATDAGWQYLYAVPDPDALAALVRAGREMLKVWPRSDQTARFDAMRAALEPFKEVRDAK